MNLEEQFGSIDIYLFDQVLRGRFANRHRILELGCGRGRNLVHFWNEGFEVHGIDADQAAVQQARERASRIAGADAAQRLQVGQLDHLPYEPDEFDAVILNAVLHFAPSRAHFERWLAEAWRVLRPGGLFFARLASKKGLEDRIVKRSENRYLLPDGTERFLIDDDMLLRYSAALGGSLLDPIKTVNVQDLRCMGTWVLQKHREP